jgi:hypothetical protein
MCPVKTENQAVNFPREEGEFWRHLAFELGARSRAELQKLLLLLGLEKVSPARAARLRAIRRKYYHWEARRAGRAALLLALFTGTMFFHEQLRPLARRVRETEIQQARF